MHTPSQFTLQRNAHGRLELVLEGSTQPEEVTPVRAFPIAAPDEGLSLVGSDGHELLWVPRLAQLPAEARALVEEELAVREFVPVIEKIAADIERLGGGVVGVIGHADRRGSDAYNVALGMRRAKAVYEAIAARLGAEARSRLRVEINDDPTAPVGLRDGREVR